MFKMEQDFIAYRLDELKEDQKAMINNFNEFKKDITIEIKALAHDITTLKTRASVWGAVAGTVATGIIYVISRILGSKF